MNKNSLKILVILLAATQIAACAGGAKKAAGADSDKASSADPQKTAPTDMTRPPVTIGTQNRVVVESNPDETISFDEWKKQQEVEKSADQPD